MNSSVEIFSDWSELTRLLVLAGVVFVFWGCGDEVEPPQANQKVCGEDKIECDGECVDTTHSTEHCGECGNACEPNGEGVVPVCTPEGCAVECEDDSETPCDDECVDTSTDDDHCGECGNSCPTDIDGGESWCVDGNCEGECEDETEAMCAGSCVDTSVADSHCGECGHSCWGSESCSDGACELREFTVETIDEATTGDEKVGRVIEVELDENDQPHFSFVQHAAGELRYLYRQDDQWALNTVAEYDDLNGNPSMTLDDADQPYFGYTVPVPEDDLVGGKVKVASPDDEASQTWESAPIIDTSTREEARGLRVDLLVEEGGDIHVAYEDYDAVKARYAKGKPGTWNIENIATKTAASYRSFLFFDSQSELRVFFGRSFSDEEMFANTHELKKATRQDESWSVDSVTDELPVHGNRYATLDDDDAYHATFTVNFVRRLDYLKYDGTDWSVETIGAEDGAEFVDPFDEGSYSAIDVDSQGKPHVAYHNSVEMRYARRIDGGWEIYPIDDTQPSLDAPAVASLAVDDDGVPHIAFRSRGDHQLRYVTLEEE